MKKLVSIVLALALVLACCSVAFAKQTEDTGKGGNGSITIKNATIDDTYTLYKLFDATLSSQTTEDGKPIINYTTSIDLTNNTWFEKDAYGNVTAKSGADITTTEFKTWAKANGTVIKSVTASDSVLEFTNLQYGYYFIESTVGTVLTVDSTTPHADVVDKNQTDTFDKYILDGTNHVTVNEAGLKEDVPFEIAVQGVNYIGEEKVYKYVIKDSIQNGFTYNAAPTVTIAGAAPVEAVTIKYYTDSTKATEVTEANIAQAQYFEITIPWAAGGVFAGAHLYGSNAEIKVNYTAHLDAEKFNNILVGGDVGNKNEANVDHYKSKETPDQDTPEGITPKKETFTFTTSLEIKKIDGTSKNPLKGAEFTLVGPNGPVSVTVKQVFTADSTGEYWKLKNGTYTTQDPNGTINGNPVDQSVYESVTQKYKAESVTEIQNASGAATGSVATVGDDGLVKFSGLAAGEYTLTETKVPDGYNAIAPITFTISFDPDTKEFSSNNSNIKLDGATNTFKTTVENNRGTELPSTGGIGTTIFYILGGLLVIGAAVILVARRKAQD